MDPETHHELKRETHSETVGEILTAFVRIGATSDARSVTVERLQLEVHHPDLREFLERLVDQGYIRRIEYRSPNEVSRGLTCSRPAVNLYSCFRYCLRTHTEQFDLTNRRDTSDSVGP
jgi:hypothetical protein